MGRELLLTELNSYVKRAQHILADYLPEESGKSEKDTIAALLGILDNRGLLRLQKRIRNKPALFSPSP